MPFITLGTVNQLQIKVPTIGSTDWGDTLRTDTFLKIAEHDHSGSGQGTPLGAGSLAANSVTGANIRLDNDEYLRGRNNANSADINILKINTSDKLVVDAELGAGFKLGNNLAVQHRNQANSAYISTISLNTSDKIALGADLANLAIINNTYIQSRNNADSGYINILKINASDKIEVGANILAVNIETTSTSLIDTLDSAVTLADNQTTTSAGIVTLSTDESCSVHYRIVRNGVTQSGVLRFTDTETVPSESYTGTDVGVTFTVSAGALQYATTSTGNTASMTYVVIKE